MKVGDKLQFKKFDWVLVNRRRHISGVVEYRYRVYRKYFKVGGSYRIPLTNTNCNYTIYPWHWNFIKKELTKNPDYHYTMHLWSNCKRKLSITK